MADWTEIGPCKLACGDCLEILPELEAGSVDAVIVDIPYGEVNRPSAGLRTFDKGSADVETFSLEEVVSETVRLTCGSVYVWCGTEQVSGLRAGFVKAGLATRMCGWEKSNASPVNGQYLWLSSFECCVFARKPKAHFHAQCLSPIWRGPTERRQKHPTQKPLWLMEHLVSVSVPPMGIALDFCMGSGSTGVACVRLGRAFVGVEISPEYFDIACRRIENEVKNRQGRLFD